MTHTEGFPRLRVSSQGLPAVPLPPAAPPRVCLWGSPVPWETLSQEREGARGWASPVSHTASGLLGWAPICNTRTTVFISTRKTQGNLRAFCWHQTRGRRARRTKPTRGWRCGPRVLRPARERLSRLAPPRRAQDCGAPGGGPAPAAQGRVWNSPSQGPGVRARRFPANPPAPARGGGAGRARGVPARPRGALPAPAPFTNRFPPAASASRARPPRLRPAPRGPAPAPDAPMAPMIGWTRRSSVTRAAGGARDARAGGGAECRSWCSRVRPAPPAEPPARRSRCMVLPRAAAEPPPAAPRPPAPPPLPPPSSAPPAPGGGARTPAVWSGYSLQWVTIFLWVPPARAPRPGPSPRWPPGYRSSPPPSPPCCLFVLSPGPRRLRAASRSAGLRLPTGGPLGSRARPVAARLGLPPAGAPLLPPPACAPSSLLHREGWRWRPLRGSWAARPGHKAALWARLPLAPPADPAFSPPGSVRRSPPGQVGPPAGKGDAAVAPRPGPCREPPAGWKPSRAAAPGDKMAPRRAPDRGVMRTRDRRSRGDGPAWPAGRCHGRDSVTAPGRDWEGEAGSAAPRGSGAAVVRGCPGKPGLVRGRLPGWLLGLPAAAGARPPPRPHVRGWGHGGGGRAAALSPSYSGGESVPAASEDVSPFQNELSAVEVGYARIRVCSRHCSAGKVRRRVIKYTLKRMFL